MNMTKLALPKPVVDVVMRVADGWSPTLGAGRPITCRWGELDLSAAVESFEIAESNIRFYFRERSPGAVNEAIKGHQDEALLEGVCDDGLQFRVEDVVQGPSDSSFPPGPAELRLDGYTWDLNVSGTTPVCWVARLRGFPKVHRANLHLVRTVLVNGAKKPLGSGGHLFLRGAVEYCVIAPGGDPSYLVILSSTLPERTALDADVATLSFAVGRRLILERCHGVDEAGNIVAQRSDTHGRTMVPTTAPTVLLLAPITWIAPFFRAVSDKVRSAADPAIRVAISFYLDGLLGTLHSQVVHLSIALEALAHWSVEADSGQSRASAMRPSEVISLALARHGIPIPRELLNELMNTRNLIVHTGISAESDASELIRIIQTLQTLVAALVSKLSDYDGDLAPWPHMVVNGQTVTSPLQADWWQSGTTSHAAAMERFEIHQEAALGEPRFELQLLVEGPTDVVIVTHLLRAARLAERVGVSAVGGTWTPALFASCIEGALAKRFAILVDVDARSIPDAIAAIRERTGSSDVEVFGAVPTAEAWLFADEEAARHAAATLGSESLLARLPLPEEISRPKDLAHQAFGGVPNWAFLENIDVARAMGRSASLRSFIEGLYRLLGEPLNKLAYGGSRSFSRDVLSSLLGEIAPADSVAWRTADGASFTAEQLRREIESGSELGQQYASDLLRVARDMLARQATRGMKA
jgi:hypothetical protein